MLKKNGLIELFDEDDEPPPDLLAECDSDETIQAIKNVIQERYTVLPVESDEYAFDVLRDSKPDLVFNIAERLTGPNRESHIPTLCEMLHIPYTGSDPLTLGICLVKSRAKEILSYHGIANPEFHAVDNTEGIPPDIELPAIIKPLYEGSSKGIRDNSVVRTREELKERVNEITAIYQQPVIIEQFLNGREFTVGVLGNYPNIEILPIVEIDHSSLPDNANPIYSYEAKWIWDTTDKPLRIFTCPAKLSNKLRDQIEKLVIRTCRILNIKDWARIDVRLDDKGTPNIIEVNPLPGILPREEENSCLPKAARTAGYSYSQLIHRVIDETFLRYGG
ncbi:MAG: ATP-grasp domain-containing protein [candidate division KSB1 bacterium]|nr:ATP-grasp domain-containing protein [candidate division KSB1 bacterium]